MVISLIIFAGILILTIFLFLNKKNETGSREGFMREVLDKDVFVVEFDDQKATIVKFHGISMASENEMLDEQIFKFLQECVCGNRMVVNPKRIAIGDVIIGEIYSLSGEYLNAVMVRQGFARWVPSEAASDRFLMEAQEEAQKDQVGIWNPTVQRLMVEKSRNSNPEDDEDLATRSIDPEEYVTKADTSESS